MDISEACAPHVQRQVTFYREPLQPEQIVAYALYRWATGESYDNSTSSFDMGRTSEIRALRDVTAAILRVYGEKISWPTGVRKQVVIRAFLDKGFPNCHGAVDCTHIYVDKPANAPSENYFDRKHRFFFIAQVVVDLNLRVLDAFVGYPGSCHDIRVIQLSSLSRHAEEGLLFRGPPVTLPGGVTANGYILGDNGYPPSEWVVVPYGGINQHPDEERFDTKQKVARGAVEGHFPQHPARCRNRVRREFVVGGRRERGEAASGPGDSSPPAASVHVDFDARGSCAPQCTGAADETCLIQPVAYLFVPFRSCPAIVGQQLFRLSLTRAITSEGLPSRSGSFQMFVLVFHDAV
ncbi:hypothetical protein CBR_g36932 [Chara braunii]|uniref:DDE Tnp4 domain-containing protein n=1 Tax=Chara braunii TaxID=69332 RepID=A0A388JZN6_CHABU|nr:hypothetical protein CBR_g36932 [Chara braunii]|eukprot:GBG63163.1 hypothetical protein CBR_g36932 [Chara braunii]